MKTETLPPKLSPSLMCADPFCLRETLDEFLRCGVEYLHLDVMDGVFVPNFTLGTDLCRRIKAYSPIPLDLHLMIGAPEQKLGWFAFGAGDIVSLHAESTRHLQKALAAVLERGGLPFVALNPATPLCFLEPVLDDLAGVLVMAVNPGFAGQKMIPSTLRKIAAVRALLDENGRTDACIEVDGNVSPENAKKMRRAGADIFVAGTASIFKPDLPLSAGLAGLREAVRP